MIVTQDKPQKRSRDLFESLKITGGYNITTVWSQLLVLQEGQWRIVSVSIHGARTEQTLHDPLPIRRDVRETTICVPI
jgi:hypothetical protein